MTRKHMVWVLLLVTGFRTITRADTVEAPVDGAVVALRELRQRWTHEPPVRALQDAAAAAVLAQPSVVAGWMDRVRKAPWLPVLRVEYRHVVTDDQRLKVGGGTEPSQQRDVGAEYRPLVRAQWELDRLLFDPAELRVANQAVEMARLREAVVDRVTRLYFERRRLQVSLVLETDRPAAEMLDRELRIQEVEALLDGLTAGAFSKTG